MEHIMSRRQASIKKSLGVAAALAVVASGAAFADDNSMSRWTGDSYAHFNNLDYNPGRFNTARAPEVPNQVATTKLRDMEPHKRERPVMLADRPYKTIPTNPFRDDTGA